MAEVVSKSLDWPASYYPFIYLL